MYAHTVGSQRYHFRDLRTLLAKATPARSGDALAGLAGLAAESAEERVAAQMALSDLPLRSFVSEAIVPYEVDEVTRLIMDSHAALPWTWSSSRSAALRRPIGASESRSRCWPRPGTRRWR